MTKIHKYERVPKSLKNSENIEKRKLFILFPKGEFLRTHHCWVPLFRMLSFSCFIVLKFFTPTFRGLYLVVGGGGGWWWVVGGRTRILGQILTFFKVVWKLF